MRPVNEPDDLAAAVRLRLQAYATDPRAYFRVETGGRRSVWRCAYRARMDAGMERCRNCNCGQTDENRLSFDHIIPKAVGAPLTMDNTAILCQACNEAKGMSLWAHLRSLADEEAAAPAGQRWAAIAQKRGDYQ